MDIKQHSSKIYENSLQITCEAKIIDIVTQQVKIIQNGKPIFEDAVGLVLDQTVFHPQGGGQPSDKGTIDNTAVLTVREDKEQDPRPIYHFLDAKDITHTFKIGQTVVLNVDGAYRKKCAISHTAGHLIADVLELNPNFSVYKALSTQGHHFPGGEYIKAVIKADIDNKEQFINDLNLYIKEAIVSDMPITTDFSNSVRHIKIGESKRMCGGTHLTTTKDIISCTVNKVKVSKVNKDGIESIEATIYYNC